MQAASTTFGNLCSHRLAAYRVLAAKNRTTRDMVRKTTLVRTGNHFPQGKAEHIDAAESSEFATAVKRPQLAAEAVLRFGGRVSFHEERNGSNAGT